MEMLYVTFCDFVLHNSALFFDIPQAISFRLLFARAYYRLCAYGWFVKFSFELR